MLNYLDQHPGLSILVAFIIAFLGWIFSVIRESRNKYRQKRNLLEAIKLEIDFDAGWIQDLSPKGEDAVRYYDPTRANFRLRDDAITYAITNGQSVLLEDKDFIRILISVSHAARFVNQQIQEQHDCRFSSPEITGLATKIYTKDNNVLKKWMCDENNRPEELRNWLEELHLRNWAINNVGFRQQLKPSIEIAIPAINKIIDRMDSSKRWWHFWKS